MIKKNIKSGLYISNAIRVIVDGVCSFGATLIIDPYLYKFRYAFYIFVFY